MHFNKSTMMETEKPNTNQTATFAKKKNVG